VPVVRRQVTPWAGVVRQIGWLALDNQPSRPMALAANAKEIRSAGAADSDDAKIAGVESKAAFPAANLPSRCEIFHGEARIT
jgi:hypothetical protein